MLTTKKFNRAVALTLAFIMAFAMIFTAAPLTASAADTNLAPTATITATGTNPYNTFNKWVDENATTCCSMKNGALASGDTAFAQFAFDGNVDVSSIQVLFENKGATDSGDGGVGAYTFTYKLEGQAAGSDTWELIADNVAANRTDNHSQTHTLPTRKLYDKIKMTMLTAISPVGTVWPSFAEIRIFGEVPPEAPADTTVTYNYNDGNVGNWVDRAGATATNTSIAIEPGSDNAKVLKVANVYQNDTGTYLCKDWGMMTDGTYEIRMKVKPTIATGNATMGIGFRGDAAGVFNGINFMGLQGGQQNRLLAQTDAGWQDPYTSAVQTVDRDTWYTVKLKLDGSKISLWANGEVLLTDDTSWNGWGTGAGYLGLFGWGSTVDYFIDWVKVTKAIGTDATAPVITKQPKTTSFANGSTSTMSVNALSNDGGTLSYQWYSNTTATNSGGTLISGATAATYAPATSTDGTFYYYCVVTNTNNDCTGTKTATTTSNAATITVKALTAVAALTRSPGTNPLGVPQVITPYWKGGIRQITITNPGSDPITNLSAALTAGTELYICNPLATQTLNGGESTTISVATKVGVASQVAVYADTLTISGDNLTTPLAIPLTQQVTTYGYTLDTEGTTYTFPAADVGYAAQTPLVSTITCNGTQASNTFNVSLGGADPAAFTRTTPAGAAFGATTTFTVAPALGLTEARTYTATVTVRDGVPTANQTTRTFNISFTVNQSATVSQTPAASVTTVAKTAATQASVDFALTTAPAGTYAVYDAATGSTLATGVTAALSGSTLTLSHATDVPAATYYVAVTESGKTESDRLALTVGAYVPVVDETYDFSMDAAGVTYIFDDLTAGYTQPAAFKATLTSAASTDMDMLVEVTGDTAAFVCGTGTTPATLAEGGTATFEIKPAADMAAGTYNATVTIKQDVDTEDQTPVSFNVRYTVYASLLPRAAAPAYDDYGGGWIWFYGTNYVSIGKAVDGKDAYLTSQMGISLPADDFSQTNPWFNAIGQQGAGEYFIDIFRKGDGTTTRDSLPKRYATVLVIDGYPAPTNLNWDGYVAKWDTVANAGGYEVKVYKDGTLDKTISTSKNELDMTWEVVAGTYTFTVKALGGDAVVNIGSALVSELSEEMTAAGPVQIEETAYDFTENTGTWMRRNNTPATNVSTVTGIEGSENEQVLKLTAVNGQGGDVSTLVNTDWGKVKDGTLEMRMRVSGGKRTMGLSFRTPLENGAMSLPIFNGLSFMGSEGGNKVLSEIDKNIYPDPQHYSDNYGGATVAFANDTWYVVKIKFVDTKVSLWVDGVPKFESVEWAKWNTDEGYMGIYSWGATMDYYIDWVKVGVPAAADEVSTTPAATTTTVAKTVATQASVDFALTTAPAGTYAVYDAATGSTLATGVTAALTGSTLTLSHATNVPAATYYVAVTESGKTESARLALTVIEPVVAQQLAAPASATFNSGVLTFDAVEHASGYYYSVGHWDDELDDYAYLEGFEKIDVTSGADISAKLKTLPDGAYYIDVFAKGDGIYYTDSNDCNIDGLTVSTLATPGDLAWTDNAAGWTAVTNATGYSVELFKDSTSLGAQTVTTNSKDYDSVIATVDGSYTFKVKATGAVSGMNVYKDSAVSAASAANTIGGSSGGTVTTYDYASGETGTWMFAYGTPFTAVSVVDDATATTGKALKLTAVQQGVVCTDWGKQTEGTLEMRIKTTDDPAKALGLAFRSPAADMWSPKCGLVLMNGLYPTLPNQIAAFGTSVKYGYPDASVTYAATAGQWHTIKVKYTLTSVSLWVNDTLVIDNDSSMTWGQASGYMGVFTLGASDLFVDWVKVTKPADMPATPPTISTQPKTPILAYQGSSDTSLSITAALADEGTLSYQWYSNTTDSNTGGTPVAGATEATFIPPTTTIGTTYYYCQATSTIGTQTASVASTTARVKVIAASTTPVIDVYQPFSFVQHPYTPTPIATPTIDEGYQWGVFNVAVLAMSTPGVTISKKYYVTKTPASPNPATDLMFEETGYAATSARLPQLWAGSYGVYCVLTATDGTNAAAPITTPVLPFTVNPSTQHGELEIVTQPATTTFVTKGLITESLNVAAKIGYMTTWTKYYQWYSNTTPTNSGGTAIAGATDDTFAVPTNLNEGTYYYYCHITAMGCSPVTSAAATVIVNPYIAVDAVSGIPEIIEVGAELTLNGTVAPGNATRKTIVWSVLNQGTTEAQIVENEGVYTLTTMAAGTVIVTATIAGGASPTLAYTQNFEITVRPDFIAVEDIVGVPTTGTAGTPLELTGEVDPSDATNTDIVWTVKTAGTTGATISSSTLNTTAAGTVTVTATVVDGLGEDDDFTKDFTITIAPPFVAVTNITGVPTTATVGTGLALTGTVAPTNATNKTITWTVKTAGTTGATISGSTLNTTATGTVTVTATVVNGATASTNYTKDFTITVAPNTVTVTWNANGGKPVPTQTTVPKGGTINAPAAMTKTGYVFGGWYTESTFKNKVNFPVTNVQTAKTYYAKWTAITTRVIVTGGKYTIVPNANGTITFNFQPNAGNGVLSVTVDGLPVKAQTSYTTAAGVIPGTINVCCGSTTVHKCHAFTDRNVLPWFTEDICYVAERGYFGGKTKTTFDPKGSMTRGMFITVLARVYGIKEADYPTSVFTDVESDDYFCAPSAWGKETGIVGGIGNDLFAPDRTINREEMVTFLYRYAKYAKADTSASKALTGFSDGDQVTGFAQPAMKWAVASGIIGGSNGKINPKGTATRGEVAAVVTRFCKLLGK